ncbi:MAG: response regulator [Simkaniaceae bacterium]|nr:response regulator [Simkaniaceae bacterium]
MGKRVVVVDDDPDMITVIGFRLKKKGLEVETFNLGTEALNAIMTTPPDIVLLDVQMPDLTGHEIAEKMEQNESTKNIPIIFLTGKVDFDPSQEKSNRTMFLKPCNFDELTAKIEEMTS